jgi:hypothetical protein
LELEDISQCHYLRVDIVLNTNKFSYAWWYPPSIHDFIPLIAAGALPFSVARPDESVRTGKKVPKMPPLRLLL